MTPLNEWRKRLRIARAALRGDALLVKIRVENGIVTMPDCNVYLSDSDLLGNTIQVPRPIVLRADHADQLSGNWGDGIGQVQYRAREDGRD